MKKALALSIVATLVGSGLALAQAPAPQQAGPKQVAPLKIAPGDHPCSTKHFSKLDQNADGKVTQGELLAIHAKRFDDIDQNRDGSVTPAERKVARAARRAQRIKHGKGRFAHGKGGNWDQTVTRQIMVERAQKRFALLDADSNGAVTPQEAANGGHRGAGRAQARGQNAAQQGSQSQQR